MPLPGGTTVDIGFGVDPFDSATLDVDGNWTDVTDDVRSARWNTSTRANQFDVFQAGSATVTLGSTTGTYDPFNGSSPHNGNFKRNTPVRITSTHQVGTATFDVTGGALEDLWTLTSHGLAVGDKIQFSTAGTGAAPYAANTSYYVVTVNDANTFQLSATLGGAVLEGTGVDGSGWVLDRWDVQFFGFARRWVPEFTGTHDGVTIVQARDGLGLLADYDLDEITSQYRADTVATRIGRVLDDIGWPSAWRDLGNGGPQSSLTPTVWGVNAFTHCLDVANAEGGFLYVDRDGTMVHDSRLAVASESRQVTSQVTIGHTTAPTFLYGTVKLAGMGDNFRNIVRVSGETGTVQEVDNSAANEAPVAKNLLAAPIESDAAAAALAKFWADLYGTEQAHPTGCTIRVATTQTELATVLMQRRVRDLVTVQVDNPGSGTNVNQTCYIDGIAGTVDPSKLDVTYTFSSGTQYGNNLASAPGSWLIIDSATDGDVGTDKVGY